MKINQTACADCTKKERQNREVGVRLLRLSALQGDMGNERRIGGRRVGGRKTDRPWEYEVREGSKHFSQIFGLPSINTPGQLSQLTLKNRQF